MRYKYVAVDSKGKKRKGIIEASTPQGVVLALREQGLYITDVIPLEEKRKKISFGGGRVRGKTVVVFTRQLATMLNAGVPLVRSLKSIAEQHPQGSWKRVLMSIIEAVEGGSSFSEALERHLSVFSPLYVSMVRAGESSGILDAVLLRLADYLEKSRFLRNKIIGALIYPCLVLLMAFTILMGLMIVVVPKFASMFVNLGVELPAVTRFLINTSYNMLKLTFWIKVLGVGVLAIFIYKFLKRIPYIAFLIDKIKLKLPLFGKLSRAVLISRFSRTLGTLIANGVPILQAISNVKNTMGNKIIEQSLDVVYNSVKEGENLSPPLRICPIFDSVVINMISVGEETGKLDDMLMKIAENYDNQIDLYIQGITSVLEPVLIILLALIIGFIVISLFLPLVNLLNTLIQ